MIERVVKSITPTTQRRAMATANEYVRKKPLSKSLVNPLPPGIIPARIPIEGQRIRLEPLDTRVHLDELFEFAGNDDSLWTYMFAGPFDNDKSKFEAHLKNQTSSLDPVFYAIRSLSTRKACGIASLMRMSPANGVIEIGHIWLGKPLQRTTEGTEALFKLMDYAMTDLGYRRLEWKCDGMNEKSRAAATRFGYYFESIFYNHMIIKGLNRDTAWFSILDDEWRDEVKPKFEQWLSEDNFDECGQQKTSLKELIWQNRKSM